jgi:hypothetical protein
MSKPSFVVEHIAFKRRKCGHTKAYGVKSDHEERNCLFNFEQTNGGAAGRREGNRK